jgi:hypothetical protein
VTGFRAIADAIPLGTIPYDMRRSHTRVPYVIITRGRMAIREGHPAGPTRQELVLLPDAVRVNNDTTSAASYLLRAGVGVVRVRVRMLDRSSLTEAVLTVPDTGTVSLRLRR